MKLSLLGKGRNGVFRAGVIVFVIGAFIALIAGIISAFLPPYAFRAPQDDIVILFMLIMFLGLLITFLGCILLLIGWLLERRKKQAIREPQ